MHIYQPHIIGWRWDIFRNCGGRINQREKLQIQTSPFLSYTMENPEAYFFACLYLVHGQILVEAFSDVFQSLIL